MPSQTPTSWIVQHPSARLQASPFLEMPQNLVGVTDSSTGGVFAPSSGWFLFLLCISMLSLRNHIETALTCDALV
jgi:hypothetical protein